MRPPLEEPSFCKGLITPIFRISLLFCHHDQIRSSFLEVKLFLFKICWKIGSPLTVIFLSSYHITVIFEDICIEKRHLLLCFVAWPHDSSFLLIVWAPTRERAIIRMKSAHKDTIITETMLQSICFQHKQIAVCLQTMLQGICFH